MHTGRQINIEMDERETDRQAGIHTVVRYALDYINWS